MTDLERHEYSISSADQEGCGADIEIKYASLQWKIAVEEDIRKLRNRVSALERSVSEDRKKQGRDISPNKQSFATAEKDGSRGFRTCLLLVRSKKAALLQCILLTIFVITISIIGIRQFLRARNNLRAEVKPEKKFQTIDYSDIEEQYEMPYVYLYFSCSRLNNSIDLDWSNEEVNETLTHLLESQNYFQNSSVIIYWEDENNFSFLQKKLPIVEAKAFHEEEWSFNNSFYGYFRLKLADPDPSIGAFEFTIFIDTEALTVGRTLLITGFYVSLAREMSTMNWEESIYVSIDNALLDGSKVSATIDYDEKVTLTWLDGYVKYFTLSLAWYYEMGEADWKNGMVELAFRANFMIEYWEEYVTYDYYDWFSGLGGILSISSCVFFWGAYYLVVIFGEKNTMGILADMSFIFYNFENVNILKDKLLG